eukprot:3865601-Pyramimonas_sp.AAC.1
MEEFVLSCKGEADEEDLEKYLASSTTVGPSSGVPGMDNAQEKVEGKSETMNEDGQGGGDPQDEREGNAEKVPGHARGLQGHQNQGRHQESEVHRDFRERCGQAHQQ